jgi:hypothetical protein
MIADGMPDFHHPMATPHPCPAALRARFPTTRSDRHPLAPFVQVYICAIRALRRLDPSGMSLEYISERVRAYLKVRSAAPVGRVGAGALSGVALSGGEAPALR